MDNVDGNGGCIIIATSGHSTDHVLCPSSPRGHSNPFISSLPTSNFPLPKGLAAASSECRRFASALVRFPKSYWRNASRSRRNGHLAVLKGSLKCRGGGGKGDLVRPENSLRPTGWFNPFQTGNRTDPCYTPDGEANSPLLSSSPRSESTPCRTVLCQRR